MIVKIKANEYVTYEITNFGYLKAKDLMKQLFENEHITKKSEDVVESLENLLYDNKEITKAMYDMYEHVIILYLKEE